MFLSMNWISDFVDFEGLDKNKSSRSYSVLTGVAYIFPSSVNFVSSFILSFIINTTFQNNYICLRKNVNARNILFTLFGTITC